MVLTSPSKLRIDDVNMLTNEPVMLVVGGYIMSAVLLTAYK